MSIQIQSQSSNNVIPPAPQTQRKGLFSVPSFSQKPCEEEPKAPLKVKLVAMATAFVAVMGATAYLLTKKGCDLKSFTSIKKHYLSKDFEFHEKEIFTLGAASVLGGLIGGSIADKKENFKAKLRESVIQYIGNISVPLGCVALATRTYKGYGKAAVEKFVTGKSLPKFVENIPSLMTTIVSLGIGIFAGNKVGNTINEDVFGIKDNRTLKLTDMAPHVDDACFALAMGNDDNPLIQKISRIIPLALTVAGAEVGEAQEKPSIIAKCEAKKIKNIDVKKPAVEIKQAVKPKELTNRKSEIV